MARYRLRFLLQEFDLPPGETLIGRSPECQITIEDPLVSRQHARVRLVGDDATFEDLGSRNGSRVNGTPVRGPVKLGDGDRLRIGTQELVFCKVATVPLAAGKPTGFLRHCASCHLPYPEEMVACPNCGSTERADEETLSGLLGDSRQNWTLQLLVEVMQKALALDRLSDAERVLRRAMANVDERLGAGHALDDQQMDDLALSVLDIAHRTAAAAWPSWLFRAYARAALLPGGPVVGRLHDLSPELLRASAAAFDELLAAARARKTLSGVELEVVRRLETLRNGLGGGMAG